MKATAFHCSAHLSDTELLPVERACPFCNSEARLAVASLQVNPSVDLMRCQRCGATSASRMPRPQTLERYYGNYYEEQAEQVTFDRPERLASHIVRNALGSLGALGGRDLMIVDFGGGDGTHSVLAARQLLERGARSVRIGLIDHNQTTVAVDDARIEVVRATDLAEIPLGAADIVLASAIIEHIPHPREILAKLFAALRPGGVFYARTPYVLPLMKLARAAHVNLDFTYPGHVHDLGARFWNGVAEHLDLGVPIQIIRFTPSIVETTFDRHFARTLAAYVLKAPSRVFKEHYGLVGGWEVFIRRTPAEAAGN
ncbi:class I SAM-dependent methyltransferase [Lysobacter soli]|uniref:class I SAM-dependent methyltransferase n=1 Tax=Lysobacter soli TaxID=453783 RepID=UPI0024106F79|nr:methyltransferase domain-containing protein [Lysobacter soli]MDG2519171.1 methyltransferase domain-containing protein [Lysobacter soli]